MNSTIPIDLLELKTRFETWRTNRKYCASRFQMNSGTRPLKSVGVIPLRSWAVS